MQRPGYIHIQIDLVSNKKWVRSPFLIIFSHLFSILLCHTFFHPRPELILLYVLVTKFLVPDLNCLIHSFIYQFKSRLFRRLAHYALQAGDHPQSLLYIYIYLHMYDSTCIICYRKAFGPVYNANIYPCAERIYTEIVIRYFVWFCATPPLLLWHTASSKALQISNIQNMLFSYNALTRIAYIIWEQPKL